jgi:chemotaxis protein histidine kinase CheA
MFEEPKPSDNSRGNILTPQDPQSDVLPEASGFGWKLAVVLFVLMAGIAASYGWLQHDAAERLATERQDLRASLAQAKSQEDALMARVNAMSAAQAQEQAARAQAESAKREQLESETAAQTAAVSRPRARSAVVRRRVPVEDPRWKRFQEQLGEQQNALAENQKELAKNQELIAQTQANLDQAKSDINSSLQSTRSELGSDIARNHSEVVALQRKGERNYFEFSFEKSKTLHHTGPISVALRKADPKHEYCDLDMVVDDRTITRKHVNLYESISLYPEGYPLPVEVVVNHIDKDSIRGYVSEPKYHSTEQAVAAAPVPPAAPASLNSPTPASANPSTPAGVNNPPDPAAPSSDVKLEHRAGDQGTVH